jgi:hypothetical protein
MSLTLNANEARQADRLNTAIKETGKYIGVITRAEKLLSKQGTEGFGLSIKTDDGATANYLDLYTVNSKGETLPSMATVQAILCCTRTKEANEGSINFEKWDSDAKAVVKVTANGYPDLMGKRIGLLLQRELSTNTTNGNDVDRVIVAGVFEADSELTASEILDKKTQPEKLAKMLAALKPVNDRRTNKSSGAPASSGGGANHADFDDDIPFANTYARRNSYVV